MSRSRRRAHAQAHRGRRAWSERDTREAGKGRAARHKKGRRTGCRCWQSGGGRRARRSKGAAGEANTLSGAPRRLAEGHAPPSSVDMNAELLAACWTASACARVRLLAGDSRSIIARAGEQAAAGFDSDATEEHGESADRGRLPRASMSGWRAQRVLKRGQWLKAGRKEKRRLGVLLSCCHSPPTPTSGSSWSSTLALLACASLIIRKSQAPCRSAPLFPGLCLFFSSLPRKR